MDVVNGISKYYGMLECDDISIYLKKRENMVMFSILRKI